MTPTDDVLEEEPDDGQGDVIDGAGRGDEASSVEEDREAGGRNEQE